MQTCRVQRGKPCLSVFRTLSCRVCRPLSRRLLSHRVLRLSSCRCFQIQMYKPSRLSCSTFAQGGDNATSSLFSFEERLNHAFEPQILELNQAMGNINEIHNLGADSTDAEPPLDRGGSFGLAALTPRNRRGHCKPHYPAFADSHNASRNRPSSSLHRSSSRRCITGLGRHHALSPGSNFNLDPCVRCQTSGPDLGPAPRLAGPGPRQCPSRRGPSCRNSPSPS